MRIGFQIFIPIFIIIISVEKDYAQQEPIRYANNIPFTIIHDSNGVYAKQYFFSKDNLFKRKEWKGKSIWVNKLQFPTYQRTKTTWITQAKSYDKPYRALFRKKFNIEDLPTNAILFITADVRYKVYINDNYIGDGPVNIGGDYGDETPPDYWYYNSYNVNKWLNKGDNIITVEVITWGLEWCDISSSFGSLICDITDGNKTIVATNKTWKANIDTSYSYTSDFLQFDANKEILGWRTYQFDDSNWHYASFQYETENTKLFQSNIPELIRYPLLPVRILTGNSPNYQPIDIKNFYKTHHQTTKYILDFEKNMSAYISFTVTADIGDTIEVIPYEKIDYTPSPNRKYRYICKQGINSFSTPDISAFRYLYVSLKTNKEIIIKQFQAEFSSYPVQYKGAFTCSDTFYNQLWSIARYTTQLCMRDMFYDSPMHQEPIGCTGDYFLESMSNYYAFGDQWLTRQNLVQTAQMMKKNNYKMFHTSYSLLWVQMLKQYVLHTGDTAILFELLPYADKLMDRFKTYLNKDYLVAEAPNYMFMDWVKINGFNAHHPPAVIGMGYMSAMLYKAMTDIDEMRSYLNTKTNYITYKNIADSIKIGINKILWDKNLKLYKDGIPFTTHVASNYWLPADTNITTYSAHVNTLAVLYDIAPIENRNDIMNYVFNQKNYELQPYFMSYVLGAFNKINNIDMGLEMVNRWRKGIDTTTYTLKENWQDKTDFGYNGDYSHAWGGAPLVYLSQNILGISPASPGYNNIAIHPYIGTIITSANGTIPVGEKDVIKVNWFRKQNNLSFMYVIPTGKKAMFYIPKEFNKYQITIDGNQDNKVFGSFPIKEGNHTINFTIISK